MNDKRSFEIKKILKKEFPNAVVKVRIEKYSMGESIGVCTDLIKRTNHSDAVWRVEADANPVEADYKEYTEHRKTLQANKEMREKIINLIGKYQSVDYDTSTGEILVGGNTYLNVEALRE